MAEASSKPCRPPKHLLLKSRVGKRAHPAPPLPFVEVLGEVVPQKKLRIDLTCLLFLFQMLPFKKGAFHVAMDSGLPILPVVLSEYSFMDHKKRIFGAGTIHIQVNIIKISHFPSVHNLVGIMLHFK